MRFHLLPVLFLFLRPAAAQEAIPAAEARIFLDSFLQVLQYEEGPDYKERIAHFLDPESSRRYLDGSYLFLSHGAFKIEAVKPPTLKVLAAKATGAFWRYQLTFELVRIDGRLFVKGKSTEDWDFKWLTPWQTETEINIKYTPEDVVKLEADVKRYLRHRFEIRDLGLDTSLLFRKWHIDQVFSREEGEEELTPVREMLDWYGGHEFGKKGEYRFYLFGDFSNTPTPDPLTKWDLLGQYLLLFNGKEPKFAYCNLDQLNERQLALTVPDRGDITKMIYVTLEEYNKRKTAAPPVAPDTVVSIDFDTSLFSFLVHPAFDKVIGLDKEHFMVKKQERYGVFKASGEEVLPPVYDEVTTPFGQSRIRVRQGEKWMTLNRDGSLVEETSYRQEEEMTQQLEELLGIRIGASEGEKTGLLAPNGDTIIAFEYDVIREVRGSAQKYYQVTNGREGGIIRNDGELILPFEYDFSGPNPYNFPKIMVKRQGKKGFFDLEKEQWILQPIYDDLSLHDDIFNAMSDGEQFFFDAEGNPMQFAIMPSHHFGDGQLGFEQEGKRGVVGATGKVLVPPVFDAIDQLKKDYFKVKQNGNWGVYRAGDTLCIPLQYENLFLSYDITAEVKQGPLIGVRNNGAGLIDWNGKPLTEFGYSYILPRGASNRLLIAADENGAGLIDRQGRVVVPFQYDSIDEEVNGTFITETIGSGDLPTKGLISTEGKVLLPTVLDDIDLISDGSFTLFGVLGGVVAAKYKGKWGIIKLP